MTREERIAALKREAKQRILILDGAMGTMIQRYKLDEADYRGTRFQEASARSQGQQRPACANPAPRSSARFTTQYLEAGADIIETNTFNAQAISQADYGLEGCRLRDERRRRRSSRARRPTRGPSKTPDKPRFVAGAIGPTNRTASISPDVNNPGFRNVSFDELVDGLYRRRRAA